MGKLNTDMLINTVIFKEKCFHAEHNPTLDPTLVPTLDPTPDPNLETEPNSNKVKLKSTGSK